MYSGGRKKVKKELLRGKTTRGRGDPSFSVVSEGIDATVVARKEGPDRREDEQD